MGSALKHLPGRFLDPAQVGRRFALGPLRALAPDPLGLLARRSQFRLGLLFDPPGLGGGFRLEPGGGDLRGLDDLPLLLCLGGV